jgi:hypothetical protein
MSTKRSAASPDVLEKQQGDTLHCDVLTNILSYLPWTEVMKCRVVSPEWRNAALSTPVQELIVDTLDIACVLPSLATAMPWLQKLKFESGPPDDTLHVDDEMLALARGFRQLTSLVMTRTALRTCVPPHIMQLHHLETIDLTHAKLLVWDLADLSVIPRLKNLVCPLNKGLSGDISCLQSLSQTLVQLDLFGCSRVVGYLHSLALFPRLESLELYGTRVTGDVRKIGLTDFPCLKDIRLGGHVYGGRSVKCIVEAPEIMEAWCRFEARNPGIFQSNQSLGFGLDTHPYSCLETVQAIQRAGRRYGWRWTDSFQEGHCDIHWINVEPRPSDVGYGDVYAPRSGTEEWY